MNVKFDSVVINNHLYPFAIGKFCKNPSLFWGLLIWFKWSTMYNRKTELYARKVLSFVFYMDWMDLIVCQCFRIVT